MTHEAVKAKIILQKISDDLSSRKGIGDEWDIIEGHIKMEILDHWFGIIMTELKK